MKKNKIKVKKKKKKEDYTAYAYIFFIRLFIISKTGKNVELSLKEKGYKK